MGNLAMVKNFFVVGADGVVRMYLNKGYYTILDFEDWLNVCSSMWCISNPNQSRIYARRNIKRRVNGKVVQRTSRLHSDITGYMMTDHINHNGLDNRRSNLRPADKSKNAANTCKRPGGASKWKGVSWFAPGNTWVARVKHHQRYVFHRYFKCEADAATSYNFAAHLIFGEYAELNDADANRLAIGGDYEAEMRRKHEQNNNG